MSAAHRSLARLPLEVFDNITAVHSSDGLEELNRSPDQLRKEIVAKLKSYPKKTRHGQTVYESITTVGGLLRLSKPALLRALDPLLTYEECKEFYRRTCLYCAPKPVTALSLLHATKDITHLPLDTALSLADRMRHLPTDLGSLDRHLRGGIRVGYITELVGQAGAGKTQLAMQLAVMAAAFRQGAIYIDTEKKLSLQRLKEIASQRAANLNAMPVLTNQGEGDNDGFGGFSYGLGDSHNAEYDVNGMGRNDDGPLVAGAAQIQYVSSQQVLDNLTVHSPTGTEELLSVLAAAEDEILLRKQQADGSDQYFPVRLLILDSIAAPARRDFGSGSAHQRASAVLQCAQMLKRLADQFHLAVVVINQVGAVSTLSAASAETVTVDENTATTSTRAALGTSWHHCVSTRILLEHCIDPQRASERHDQAVLGATDAEPAVGSLRRATVVKSNVVGQGNPVFFEISALGVVEASSP